MKYRDADAFLGAMKGINSFIIPYNHVFQRSTCKIVVILLIACVAPFATFHNIYTQNEPHMTLLFLQYIEMVLVSLTGCVCYVWTARKVKNLEKIHRGVVFTHKLFQSFKNRAIVYNTKWVVVHDIMVVIAVLVISAAQVIDPNLEPIRHNSKPSLVYAIMGTFSYTVPLILVHCLGSFFSSCLYVLIIQLTHLNRHLKNTEVFRTAHTEDLVYAHCLIANIFKQINSAQMLPVMLLSSCTFFVVVYNLYDMLTFNLEESLNNTLGDNIGGTAWLIFWTSQLVILVVLIGNVVEQHEEFITRLHYIIIQDPTGNLGKSNRLMAHLSFNQKLEYSAAGFFTVDYKLISSIASSATTYLVILIQFAQLNVGTQKGHGDSNNKTVHNYLPTLIPYY